MRARRRASLADAIDSRFASQVFSKYFLARMRRSYYNNKRRRCDPVLEVKFTCHSKQHTATDLLYII